MPSLRSPSSTLKRATNVSLTEHLLNEAKALHINISYAAEAGLAQAIAPGFSPYAAIYSTQLQMRAL